MTTSPQPIIPTRIIPAGQPLPAPAAPPPPPVPPAVPWPGLNQGRPAPPPPPVPVDVHVTVTIDHGGWPAIPEPEPIPRWHQRVRWLYNTALALLALPIAGPWGDVLASIRDGDGLAGAWVAAVIPLTVLAFLDNARRAEAAGANPDLWGPKWRAGITRLLLWAAVLATSFTLPITTFVYALTGVTPA